MKRHQLFTNIIILVVTGLFSCSNPSGPETSYTVTISGTVLRKSSFALDSVQIVVDKPFVRDSVAADGKFKISFATPDNNPGSSKLTFSRIRFFDTTIAVSYSSTVKTIDLGTVVMVSQDSLENNATPGKPSAHANKIAFVGSSVSNLSISGAGGQDVATLTFEVRDSAGIPVDASNSVMVHFNFVNRPDLLTGFNHDSVRTDASGRAAVQLIAGKKSGIAQVQATARIDSLKLTLLSQIISIPIYGGPADSAHFTLTVAKRNIPGGVTANLRDQITALLGDSAGNPAQPGTVVQFFTNGGVIQPSGTSSSDGTVSVDLITGNPFPPGGIATVTAVVGSSNTTGSVAPSGSAKKTLRKTSVKNAMLSKLADEEFASTATPAKSSISSNSTIAAVFSQTIKVLFSGKTAISLSNPGDTNFVVPVNNTKEIDYTVADPLGNPLTEGTTIAVTADVGSDVTLSGDINITLPDTQDKNYTHFKVFVRDNRQTKTSPEAIKLSISVKSDNGNSKLDLQGALASANSVDTGSVPITARQPAQIAFLGITSSNISVAGVGGTENAVITYEVRDSLGQPIDKSQRAYATFNAQFFPNSTIGGGLPPHLIPSADSTDDQGRLHVSVVSGTQAGVLQVLVTIQLPSRTIQSSPVKISVHAGMPDQGHFTLATSRWVFPVTNNISTPVLQFTVLAGDTFSNPVDAGTAVYFHSQAGVIQTGAVTDQNGFVSNSLFDGNPSPDVSYDPTYGKGYFWVYAQTQGNYNKAVIDSLLVLRSIAPIVVTGLPDTAFISATTKISAPISFTVKDGNGNPLPDGTTISVSVVPPPNPPQTFDVSTSGDISVTIPNAAYARFSGSRITDFTFQIADKSAESIVTIEIKVDSPGIGTWTRRLIALLQ